MEPGRQERRDAASYAKQQFTRLVDSQHKLVGFKLSEFELAENAIEAKNEAEEKYGVKISITLDVEGNWWFQ